MLMLKIAINLKSRKQKHDHEPKKKNFFLNLSKFHIFEPSESIRSEIKKQHFRLNFRTKIKQ